MKLLTNAIKCNVGLLRLTRYSFAACILLINVTNGSHVSTLKQEAEYLAFSFLDHANQLEGINLVGGPLSISYVSLHWKGDNDETTMYSYDASLPAKGYPHGIDVIAEPGINEPIRTILSGPIQCCNGSADKELVNVLESLNSDRNSSIEFLNFVLIENKHIVRRWKEPCHYVYGFRKIGNKKYQVLFCRPYSKEQLLLFIQESQEGELLFLEAKQNESKISNECSSPIGRKPTEVCEQQKVLLFGSFSDDELQTYYKAVEDSAIHEKHLLALMHGNDGQGKDKQEAFATVYYGKPEYLFPYYSLVVEQIDGKWEPLRSLSLQSNPVRLSPVSFDPVSFREKVTDELIEGNAAMLHGKILERTSSPGKCMTEAELLYISEVILRLRGIEDYCDFRIQNYSSKEMEVVIGRYLCRSLSFQKHNDNWLLVNFGRCFY